MVKIRRNKAIANAHVWKFVLHGVSGGCCAGRKRPWVCSRSLQDNFLNLLESNCRVLEDYTELSRLDFIKNEILLSFFNFKNKYWQ